MWRLGVVFVAFLLFVGVLTSVGQSPSGASGETDRIAEVVADAVSYPRRETADSYLRAVLNTRAGRDGRLSVLWAEDVPHAELTDVWVRMVWRIVPQFPLPNDPDPRKPFFSWPWAKFPPDPIVGCYLVEFTYYGRTEVPRRTGCPSSRPALTPGPLVTASPRPAGDGGSSRNDDYLKAHGG